MRKHSPTLCTRVASLQEVTQLLQWAALEGWNPGVDDAQLFHSTDPSGFFVSTIDNHVVAGISLVKHSAEHAFLGLYICSPEHRGAGVGIVTWNAALTSIDNHTVGLDGVVEQQGNYRQSGFSYYFGNTRYSGIIDQGWVAAVAKNCMSNVMIRAAAPADCHNLVRYDAMIGGFERRAFFSAWLAPVDTRYTYLAFVENTIVGVVGVRACIEGFKIGPLLADSAAIAAQLLLAIVAVMDDSHVMVDIPDKNMAAITMAKSLKLEPVFETARMYFGPAPNIDASRMFGVATLELG